ncbi:hypothetical protein AB0E01_41505 [Nocardia vinacea]|uniref:hypothetical protein n=1 Tax=Nocardia vinacea TaxID=96468 RepID=UPI0033EBC671
MAFELAPALFGLAGTVIGGSVTFAANWLSARNQRKLAENTRLQEVLDRRYTAHQDLLIRTDRFMESLRALVVLLNSRAPRDSVDQHYTTYQQSWNEIYDAKAPAELAGPRELKAKLLDMFGAVAAASQYIDDWYSAEIANRSSTRAAEADELLKTFDARRIEYLEAAEQLLSAT